MKTLMEVATLANSIKKPNKTRAFDIVVDMIESEYRPTDELLAELYSFFLPSMPKKPKTDEQWVAKAMASKDVRHYLNYLYSDGRRLMATDGVRLHICETGLPVGFYDSQLSPVKVDAKYPDVDRLIPKKNGPGILVGALNAGPTDGRLFTYTLPSGGKINKRYYDEMTCGESVYLQQEGTQGAVRLDFEDGRLAVIMPLRG